VWLNIPKIELDNYQFYFVPLVVWVYPHSTTSSWLKINIDLEGEFRTQELLKR
jgi:hypothetical protein